ncbi:MAG: AI-2E family transporter [Rhizobiales bacterium 65-79]|jgi:predicted PurR-regulated permease PerM|nr:AI-2E family transporter [Hyphomicrobiales bacterium]OJU06661.1 MAG: AI-2E family transporter [Rhizobiales bacterium 65-79]
MPKAKPRRADEAATPINWRQQAFFWVGAVVVLGLFLFIFSEILLPFIAGMAVAYFLDPVADRLQKLGFSRLWATVVILLAFVIVLVLALMIIVPVLTNQFADLMKNMPDYIGRLQGLVTNFDPAWIEKTLGVSAAQLKDGLNSLMTEAIGFITTLFKSLWSSGLAIVNIVSLFVVAPVVAFYMLLDWDRMVATVDSWVPREHVETVRALAREIDSSIAGFVRGQGTLCLILGVYYAFGLTVIGLNFGLLIGLLAGVISFIPYVGSLTGLILALGVAFVQFWPDWMWIAAVACVFFVGQFIEGNILQPKLVGSSVGVHPVWLMFALLAFGALFGFVGLLVAVPCAAAIAVIMRFALARYKASPLYLGEEPAPAQRTRRRRTPSGS